MAKDGGNWRPKVGERVVFRLRSWAVVDDVVPREGEGIVVCDLRRNRAESCDYEVGILGYGDLCFYACELRPYREWLAR